MPDYRDLGYNQFLEKNPYLETARYSSLQVKGLLPVGSLSFDKASGGELTIGGKDNAGGVISVRDDNATERVLIDSSGITISDGKITIQDDTGTTVIDSFGLVSSGSFTFDSVAGTTATDTENAGVYTDVPGISLLLTLSRPAQVIFFYQMAGFIAKNLDDNADVSFLGRLVIDNVGAEPVLELQGFRYPAPWGGAATRGSTDMIWSRGNGQITMSQYVDTLSAGSHTIKMQFRSSSGGYTAFNFRGYTQLSYLVLGK